MKIFFKPKPALIFLFLFLVLFPLDSYARYRVSCKSAIFSDRTRVIRLYGKDVHKRVLPASTTKVMTALLVMEHLPMDAYVTISRRASRQQPTKLYLKPGEQYKVRDLLYAILIKSANDAAVALAEAVAGSEWKFVQMMNKKAKEIDAVHTKFVNANGLPSRRASQYTTAYDMYLIFREALKYPFFRDVIKLRYKTIVSRGGRRIALRTHNRILFKNWKRNIYGKTGYTRAAGKCFVGTLQKGDSTLIIAVFGCPNRWEDIKYIVSQYGKIRL